jgi:hypothetical protein
LRLCLAGIRKPFTISAVGVSTGSSNPAGIPDGHFADCYGNPTIFQ